MNALRRHRVERRVITHQRRVIGLAVRQRIGAQRFARRRQIFLVHKDKQPLERRDHFIFKRRPSLLAQRRLTPRRDSVRHGREGRIIRMRRRVVFDLRLERRQYIGQDLLRLGEAVGNALAHILDVLIEENRKRIQPRNVILIILLGSETGGADHIIEIGVKARIRQKRRPPALERRQRQIVLEDKAEQFGAQPVIVVNFACVDLIEAIEKGAGLFGAARVIFRRDAGDLVIIVVDAR